MFEYFIPLITVLSLTLGFGRRGKGGEDGIHIVNMSILTFAVLIWGSAASRVPIHQLSGPIQLPLDLSNWIVLTCVIATILIYIPRISKLENILRPAISALILLVATIISLMIASQDTLTIAIAGILFVVSSIMIAINGEIRSELKQVTRRDDQLKSLLKSQQILNNLSQSELNQPQIQTDHRLLSFSNEEEAKFAQSLPPTERSTIASSESLHGIKMIKSNL